ncbi:phage portal protein [Jeotgalibacillus malaysiensis]|uniref:phage portal protein n=1 Tax=Jeotgalibacillus malaysiensis TaxID=1508404 RepID=UPI00384C3F92
MNVEVGSIMNRFYSLFPCKVYTEEVPEDFEIPSMYFPEPFSFGGGDTNMTFLKTYSLNIKLFHQTKQKAYSEAEKIATAIERARSVVPMVDPAGVLTGEYLRIGRIEVRGSGPGVATIVVNWDSRYHYDRDPVPSLENFDLEGGLKDE